MYHLRNCPGMNVTHEHWTLLTLCINSLPESMLTQVYVAIRRHRTTMSIIKFRDTIRYQKPWHCRRPVISLIGSNVYNWYTPVHSVCKFHLYSDEIPRPIRSHFQLLQQDDRMGRDGGCYWRVNSNLVAAVSHRPATRLAVDWWRVGDAVNQVRLGLTDNV